MAETDTEKSQSEHGETDVLDRLDHHVPTRFYWSLTLLATIGGFLFGYDTANIGSALPFVPYGLNDFWTGYLVAGASLAGDHTFQHDTLALEAGASYVYLKRLDPMGVQMGSRLDRQINDAYKAALAQRDRKTLGSLREEQRDFIGTRNKSFGRTAYNLRREMEQRLFALRGLTAARN